jgi:sigma-B regulation protein RsbU (phosphoserine phosphatase)
MNPLLMVPGQGHTVLALVEGQPASAQQVHSLDRLSDPLLSELGLDEFLDELLVRVRDALVVDTVAILLLDEESEHLVACAAKGLEEEVEREVRIPVGRGFAGRIASERAAIFIADVDQADVVNPILREVGIKSLLGVPLIVQGDLIGVLHVGSLTGRVFGERDLAVLQSAAASAAPGIERARLFWALEHEHNVALILQRSLLPKRLDPPAGLAAAARYLPATELVGGDWYDTFSLSGGRLGVAIGDVVGHGVRAAALMGQLRTALRAFATQDHDPGQTLDLVDQFAHSIPEDAMATAVYAVVDPHKQRIQIAGAGHLPPLILDAGSSRIVQLTPSAPLGAFRDTHREQLDLSLRAGETLVLYTDGLVERRDVPLDESIDRLREIITGASSPEEMCRLAIEQLVPFDDHPDDLAILAVMHL